MLVYESVEISEIRLKNLELHFVPGPIPIPALACPYSTGLELPSAHSYGYGLQSSPAPSRICPAPSSGILVKYAG